MAAFCRSAMDSNVDVDVEKPLLVTMDRDDGIKDAVDAAELGFNFLKYYMML
jgi:hypothetical protein